MVVERTKFESPASAVLSRLSELNDALAPELLSKHCVELLTVFNPFETLIEVLFTHGTWRSLPFELRGCRSEADGTKMRSILAVPLERWLGMFIDKFSNYLYCLRDISRLYSTDRDVNSSQLQLA